MKGSGKFNKCGRKYDWANFSKIIPAMCSCHCRAMEFSLLTSGCYISRYTTYDFIVITALPFMKLLWIFRSLTLNI